MSAGAALDLLIPGLFGPVPIPPADVPPTPALDRLLARAERVSAESGVEAALLGRFGVAPGGDLPSAAFSRLADDPGADPAGWWLHADPVHLRPDRDQLRLFDARHLAVTREEANALVALFNAHFSTEGLRLEAPLPGRWYLQAEHPPEIRTCPLSAAAGRSVDPLLPRGPDARDWLRFLNEVQMLFHGAQVNDRRERAGRPPINGLWTWGGGRMPAGRIETRYGSVHAGHPLALGLARAAGIPAQPAPAEGGPCLPPAQGAVLSVWEGLWPAVLDLDPGGWAAGLERLEVCAAEWLAALRAGRLGTLTIDPCTGETFWLTRAGLRRFWRRSRPLAERMLAPRVAAEPTLR